MMISDKKKIAPNAANIGSEAGTKPSAHTAAYSIPNNSINATKEQGYIESLLPHGEENAISTIDLLRITGIHTSRELKNRISSERKRGACILSKTSGGYFLHSDGEKGKQELRRYVATIRAKSIHTMEAANPALNELRKIEGQETIEGF